MGRVDSLTTAVGDDECLQMWATGCKGKVWGAEERGRFLMVSPPEAMRPRFVAVALGFIPPNSGDRTSP